MPFRLRRAVPATEAIEPETPVVGCGCNCSEKVVVKVKILNPEATVPTFSSKGAVGADVSCLEDFTILPRASKTVGLGFAVEIPEGFEIQVRSRSGLASKHNITILNSPGTIDPDYRGEVMAILFNHGSRSVVVPKGTRVAQLILSEVPSSRYQAETGLSRTERGEGGLGSTGL